VAGASQQHELGVRAGSAQRVMQSFPFGWCDDVITVTVGDEEGWRLGRDSGDQAEAPGAVGGVNDRPHAE
jgi:hypothetical protein